MGTVTDASLLAGDEIDDIIEQIIVPSLHGCVREGFPFRGILFLGLMITDTGVKVLEYNVRFGDPETQSIMVRLETDLADICEAMLDGKLSALDVKWRPGSSTCVVLASEGYPGKPRTGNVIQGLDEAAAVEGIEVFHAGTADGADGSIVTAGGRVLGVTATGGDLTAALAAAYTAAGKISFDGMQYRRDIGRVD
jgi:phosphoribosylamine--glycine ligase